MLRQKLQEDQLLALKAKDVEKLQTLRYILSQIKNIEIDKKTELNDDEVTEVFRKEIKKLDDSITAFEKAKRTDLAKEYTDQKNILSAYLPKELSDENLQTEVKKLKDANADLFTANPNALIGICVKELKSKASPGRIAQAVRSLQ